MNFPRTLSLLTLSTLAACSTSEPKTSPSAEPSSFIEAIRNRFNEATNESPSEEAALESLQQASFLKDYASRYPALFGAKLYTNEELLNPEFQPEGVYLKKMPNVRLLQFFLRNGRAATLEAADELGAKRHRTELTHDHIHTQLFREAGINVEGRSVDWLEVDSKMESGSMFRGGKSYGGKDEMILLVARRPVGLDSFIEEPAAFVGYHVDPSKEMESVIVNEMTHEIQEKYFTELFFTPDGTFTEPFRSFTSEVPGLQLKNNAQAGEFLSDVASWTVDGGSTFRFFNPLYYMDARSKYYGGPEDRYAYTYAVQKYAMEKVLRDKGYSDPKGIVERLIGVAEASTVGNEPEYALAREYFSEEDFKKIGRIYRRIGVELLKAMAPYFKEPLDEKPAAH